MAIAGLVATILGIVLLATAGHDTHGAHAEGGHHAFHWSHRLWANLWINNVYFVGLAIIGVFFVALQYVSQAGWSISFIRIPLAFGSWLPIAGILMLVVFVLSNLISDYHFFHWLDPSLYNEFLEDGVTPNPNYDHIIAGKEGYLNLWFYLGRMIAYFAIWIYFFRLIRKHALAEDINGGVIHYHKLVKYSAIFIIFFAVTSSTSAWDWVMSVDPHWFSTMFGWYVFASWFVSGLAAIALVLVMLKERGYLKIVNTSHLHDMGKFVFAFSIFWTYIWFSQFLLIYYANIPEESIYFVERLTSDHYSVIFFINLLLNFCFPFFVLMTRDSKRQAIIMKLVCIVVLIGHWFDFYLMITPGPLRENGGFGFLEIGVALIYTAAFAFTILTSLAKAPLIAKNHPMLEESVHHHI